MIIRNAYIWVDTFQKKNNNINNNFFDVQSVLLRQKKVPLLKKKNCSQPLKMNLTNRKHNIRKFKYIYFLRHIKIWRRYLLKWQNEKKKKFLYMMGLNSFNKTSSIFGILFCNTHRKQTLSFIRIFTYYLLNI